MTGSYCLSVTGTGFWRDFREFRLPCSQCRRYSGKETAPAGQRTLFDAFCRESELLSNEDALLHFADRIAPELEKRMRGKWRLRVVGAFREASAPKIPLLPRNGICRLVERPGPEYEARILRLFP
jgi:hypothetical protein